MKKFGTYVRGGAGLCALAALLSLVAGCPAGGPVEGTVVDVSLEEYSVTPQVASAPAGTITFRVSNDGVITHDFHVIRTDLDADDLPTEDNGAYEVDGEGTDDLENIAFLFPGQTGNLVIDLDEGSYVLICNMVNQGMGHYSQGMYAEFTVTSSGGE